MAINSVSSDIPVATPYPIVFIEFIRPKTCRLEPHCGSKDLINLGCELWLIGSLHRARGSTFTSQRCGSVVGMTPWKDIACCPACLHDCMDIQYLCYIWLHIFIYSKHGTPRSMLHVNDSHTVQLLLQLPLDLLLQLPSYPFSSFPSIALIAISYYRLSVVCLKSTPSLSFDPGSFVFGSFLPYPLLAEPYSWNPSRYGTLVWWEGRVRDLLWPHGAGRV